MNISPALRATGTYPFVKLEQAKRRLAADGVDLIDFGKGDPMEATDPAIRRALIDALEERMGYPLAEGLPELRTAIASWCTAAGRQSPFVAQTLPMHVDRDRLAAHTARQRARGGRHLSDLRQPHWDRAAGTRAPERQGAGALPAPSLTEPLAQTATHALPQRASESYRELVELDRARSARWASVTAPMRPLTPDGLDLEILETIAILGHVLSSQLHRRFNPRKAPTTTQRRLKRLSDAGLVKRFQFHRGDGGGVPMCYAISNRGLQLLQAAGAAEPDPPAAPPAFTPSAAPAGRERQLRQARHDVHVAGWVLALVALAGSRRARVRATDAPGLQVPPHDGRGGREALGPATLRLPGGRVPHDFLRTDASGRRVEAERFDSVRPHAVVEILGAGTGATPATPLAQIDGEQSPHADCALDVLVERDDRTAAGKLVAKLERYEHFLAGWSVHTKRYGLRLRAVPLVVFVCRDRARARAVARSADSLLRACRAYPGEYPFDWEYHGRRQIVFVAERDMHEGVTLAYAVPPLPPQARIAAAGGDPRAGESAGEARELLLIDGSDG